MHPILASEALPVIVLVCATIICAASFSWSVIRAIQEFSAARAWRKFAPAPSLELMGFYTGPPTLEQVPICLIWAEPDHNPPSWADVVALQFV